jgi:endonuclease-3
VTRTSSSSLAFSSARERIPLILRRVGPSRRRPVHARRRDPLDTLIGTVLSQNTTDANSGRAFEQLKERFPHWEEVLRARPERIASTIRSGGLAEVKSRRIRRILKQIAQDRGKLDLSFLSRLPLETARRYLQNLPGVGPKTAACVLLFSLGKPAFPVDTHVLRVSKRLGLIPADTDMERAHDIFGTLLDSAQASPGRTSYGRREMLALHLGLVKHGREVCVARLPRCRVCTLFDLCPRIGVSAAVAVGKRER